MELNITEANLRESLRVTNISLERWRDLAASQAKTLQELDSDSRGWRTWACFWWLATMICFIGLLTEAARCHHG